MGFPLQILKRRKLFHNIKSGKSILFKRRLTEEFQSALFNLSLLKSTLFKLEDLPNLLSILSKIRQLVPIVLQNVL